MSPDQVAIWIGFAVTVMGSIAGIMLALAKVIESLAKHAAARPSRKMKKQEFIEKVLLEMSANFDQRKFDVIVQTYEEHIK